MKARWLALEDRYDRMAPRERVLVATGVMAVLGYAWLLLFLDPALAERQRIDKDAAALQARARTLDQALSRPGGTAEPAAQRAYRNDLRAQIEALDGEMRGMRRALVAPSDMPALLRRVLKNNRHLQLLSLKNLPVERLGGPAAPPSGPAAGPATIPPAPHRVIYRHTFELQLAGGYAELHAYLEELERMPWQMYWGRLEVDAKDYPRLLATLTVHTLSLDKAWLSV